MERLKSKLGNLRNVLTIIFVAICIAIVASAGMLKSKITVDQNQAAEELYAGGDLTSKDVIVRACQLLGKGYANGAKGGDAYRMEPTFYSAENVSNIDCSGLIYWTFGGLGVRTYGVSDFAQNFGFPVDTTHWLTYKRVYDAWPYLWKECSNEPTALSVKDATLRFTYGGATKKIEVLKANETITSNYRYYNYDGNKVLPAGTVVVSYGGNINTSKTTDHSWITLGDLGTSDVNQVINILKNMGVSESLLNGNVYRTGGDCTYWRIESNGSQGVVINNGNPGDGDTSSGKTVKNIWAFKLANEEIDGEYTFNIVKLDRNGNPVNIGQNTFYVAKIENGSEHRISSFNRNANRIRISRDNLKNAKEGDKDTYVIREAHAPAGYLPYGHTIKVEVLISVDRQRNRKVGVANRLWIDNQEKSIAGGYRDNDIALDWNAAASDIGVTIKEDELKGEFNLDIIKTDLNSQPVTINQNTFSVKRNNTPVNNLPISNNKITISENISNMNLGTEISYLIKEENAPVGYEIYNNPIEIIIGITSSADNSKKIGYVKDFKINGRTAQGFRDGYDSTNVKFDFDDPNSHVVLKVKDKKIEGSYNLDVIKSDENEKGLNGAMFETQMITQNNGFQGTWEKLTPYNNRALFRYGSRAINEIQSCDVYKIKETTTPHGYEPFNKQIILQVFKKEENNKYTVDHVNVYVFDKDDEITAEALEDAPNNPHCIARNGVSTTAYYNDGLNVFQVDISNTYPVQITTTVVNKKVDLALKKKVNKINGKLAYFNDDNTSFDTYQDRFWDEDSAQLFYETWGIDPVNYIDVSPLATTTNATYYMNKMPIDVKVGDEIEYSIRVYNEGGVDAKASKIYDYIPVGLELRSVAYNGETLTTDNTNTNYYSINEKGWLDVEINGTDSFINHYVKGTSTTLAYDEILVTCVVNDDAEGVLTNVAEIAKYKTPAGEIDEDIDSVAGNWYAPNDEDKYTNDKSTPDWKNYGHRDFDPSEPDKWRDDYLAQDEGIGNNKGDDDDFEKLVVKKDAKLIIRKVDENNANIDDVQFEITRDGDFRSTFVSVNQETKTIERSFELSSNEEQENEFVIKEYENASYIQLLGPIYIKTEASNGRLQGYYFTYNTGSPRSTQLETASEKVFKCESASGIMLDVKVLFNADNNTIEVVISNVRKDEANYGIKLRKVSKSDMKTPLEGVTFKGTKSIGGAEATAITNTQGTEGLVTDANGYTEMITTAMNYDTYGVEDVYTINEIDLGSNGSQYTKLDGDIVIKAYKSLDANNKLQVRMFEVTPANGRTAWVSSNGQTRTVTAYDEDRRSYPINFSFKTDGEGMNYLEVAVSNIPEETLPLWINKLEVDGTPIAAEGTELTVLKETEEGDAQLFSGIVVNGLVKIDDSIKVDSTSVTYKVYEDKPATDHRNVFGEGEKYIVLTVDLTNGEPTATHAAIYRENDEQTGDELLDYIDSRVATKTIGANDVKVVELDIKNPEVEKKVDLALKKIITQVEVNGVYKDVTAANGFAQKFDRLTNERIVSTPLQTEPNHDAEYYLNKTPIQVVRGTKVKYQIRIYNESNEQPATASQIIDYLPVGLRIAKNGNDYAIYYRDETTPLDSSKYSYNEQTNTLRVNILDDKELIPVYDATNDTLSSDYITVECIVEDNAEGILTNMAEISQYKTEDGIIMVDIDSEAGNWRNPVTRVTRNNETVNRKSAFWVNYFGDFFQPRKNTYEEGAFKNYLGLEDDDDFEKLEVVEIDLALKKIITKVNDTPESEFTDAFKRFQDGDIVVDVRKLNRTNDYKTGEYFMNKTPVQVQMNDTITYQIRVYNEGTIDATASKIIDYIPKGLELAKDGEDYCVYYKDETTPLSSDYYTYNAETNVLEINKLKDELIPAYTGTANNLVTPPSYSYITVKCKINGTATGLLTNVAEIAQYKTMYGETYIDRDSETVGRGEWKAPSGSNKATLNGKSGTAWARYYDNITTGAFQDYPGQQDDDDFEKIYVKSKVKVSLKKVSRLNHGIALEGIGFNVNGTNYTTDSEGMIDLGTYDINEGLTTFNIQEQATDGNYVTIRNPIAIGLRPSAPTAEGGRTLAGYVINLKDGNLSNAMLGDNRIPSTRTYEVTTTEDDENNPNTHGGLSYTVNLTVKVSMDEDTPGNYKVELELENTPPKTLYDLFIKKVDEAGNIIEGVKFNVSAYSLYNNTRNNNLVTDEDGNAYIGRFPITERNSNDVDTIFIKEIETPYKHYILKDELCLEVTKGINLSRTGYEVKKVRLISGTDSSDGVVSSEEGKDITLEGVKVVGSDKTVTISAKVLPVQNSEGERAQRITITIENKNKEFDLSLRKFITKVEEGFGETKVNRWSNPKVDVSGLLGGLDTTAVYNNTKEPPVEVHRKDIVTYGIRVYNEGEIGGYAEYVIDDVPEGVQMIKPGDGSNNTSELNSKYNWKMYKLAEAGETADLTYAGNSYVETDNPELAIIIGTDYLSKASGERIMADWEDADDMENINYLIPFDQTMDEPAGREVEVEFKVKEDATVGDIIENKAQIYRHCDEGGDSTIEDRDSTPGEWENPPRDDDQDIERILVLRDKEYDLALRKFITKVNDEELEESREPVVDCAKLVAGETTADKVHTKEPVLVQPKDIVEYTLRVYNEGKDDAYADSIVDDIPKGTKVIAPEYAEDGTPLNMNAEYGWVMYRQVREGEMIIPEAVITVDGKSYIPTSNADEAEIIKTEYLSFARDAVANLLKAFDLEAGVMKPENYRDVKVQYAVCEQDEVEADKILINYAQIHSMSDENGNTPVIDRDSTPGIWEDTPRDDDQDIEKIKVGYFDLALYKWVSTALVTEDGKTTEYPSEHTQSDKSNVVNVSIPKDKLKNVTVKFKYQIKIENEGTIPGKALEIKDHIPEGLIFVEEDNKEFGWKQNEDGTIVTDYLKDTVLQPKETAEVTVVLTWVNGENNLGKKINYAEISKDYNDYGWPDIDSTPDNFKDTPREDDEDGDEVMLQVRTGASAIAYIVIGLVAMTIVAGGAFGVKKFVIK